MPYPPILRDINGDPLPQVWDKEIGNWRPVTGDDYGQRVRILGADGRLIDTDNPLYVSGSVSVQGRVDALRQTIVTGAKTVTSTAAEIFAGSSRLAGRHAMVVTNTGTDIVYIGTSGVTTSNGFPLFPQDTLRIEFDPTSSVGVFACTSGPNVQMRVVELA